MFSNRSKLFLSFFVVSATLFTFSRSSQALSLVGTEADINVLTGADQDSASAIAPFASSHVDFLDNLSSPPAKGTASAEATGTTLKATAESESVGVVNGSHASSSFRNSYVLTGNPDNLDIPLTFNFNLTGSLSQSTPKRSIAIGAFNYDITNYASTGTSSQGGGVLLTTEAGFPVFFSQSGELGENLLSLKITPSLSVGPDAQAIKKFLAEDLEKSGILVPKAVQGIDRDKLLEISAKKLKGNPIEVVNERLFALNAIISNAIELGYLAIPTPPGTKVEFGYDLEYLFNSKIQLTQILRQGGELDAFFQVSADASPNATAITNFGNTLKLTSITAPQDFTAIDINNLKVAFDSGDTFSVTREVNVTSVPTPALLPGLVGMGIAAWRKRKGLVA